MRPSLPCLARSSIGALTTVCSRAVLAAVVAVALLCALAPAPARAVQTGVVPDLTWGTSATDQDRTAASIKDVGAKWVRLSVNWRDAEPSRGVYNSWWIAQYDRAVALARGAGAHVVLMVSESPAWASGSSASYAPPRDPADFARFMRFLSARYAGAGVDAYEIWNEPNISRFWTTGPNPAAYAALLKAAYPAVKAGDPNAKVVFGGLSTSDYDYLSRAYAAGAKGSFDVMAVHPYSCATAPTDVRRGPDGRIVHDVFLGYREVEATMAAQGDHKPVWFTEFGWSTTSASCGVSETTQAAYLTSALALAQRDPNVQVACWYNLRNNYWSHDADGVEERYGLTRTDYSTKPAFAALKAFGLAAPSVSGSTSSIRSPSSRRQTTAVRLTATSGTRRLAVRSASARASRGRGVRGVRGSVLHASTGTVAVLLQRFDARRHAWRTVVRRTVGLDSGGRFATPLSPRGSRALWRVCARFAGTPQLSAASSRWRRLRT